MDNLSQNYIIGSESIINKINWFSEIIYELNKKYKDDVHTSNFIPNFPKIDQIGSIKRVDRNIFSIQASYLTNNKIVSSPVVNSYDEGWRIEKGEFRVGIAIKLPSILIETDDRDKITSWFIGFYEEGKIQKLKNIKKSLINKLDILSKEMAEITKTLSSDLLKDIEVEL